MIYYNKEMLFLLVPLCIVLLYLLYKNKKKKLTLKWGSLSYISKISSSIRVKLYPLVFLFQLVSAVLIIFALARPQEVNVQSYRSMKGIDIIVLLDISFSMEAEDMNPGSRLNAAKEVLSRFVDGLSSDRVGLVLFSGEAYTKVPLTLDYSLLQQTISRVETSSDIKQGTAIGEATATAIARLRNSQSKSKVIILLTDGENNQGAVSPTTAIHIAKEYGIKIYSIGVGSQSRARVPIKVRDRRGQMRTVYTHINSRINKKLLMKMSNETGGQFYFAKNLKNLDKVFQSIGRLEKTVVKAKQWLKKEERFKVFLEPAFFFYLISILLSITIFGKVL